MVQPPINDEGALEQAIDAALTHQPVTWHCALTLQAEPALRSFSTISAHCLHVSSGKTGLFPHGATNSIGATAGLPGNETLQHTFLPGEPICCQI